MSKTAKEVIAEALNAHKVKLQIEIQERARSIGLIEVGIDRHEDEISILKDRLVGMWVSLEDDKQIKRDLESALKSILEALAGKKDLI